MVGNFNLFMVHFEYFSVISTDVSCMRICATLSRHLPSLIYMQYNVNSKFLRTSNSEIVKGCSVKDLF